MNDLAFVGELIEWLSRERIAVWLFGGWAEELSGSAEPRDHHDVDLLYPAESFERVDDLILQRGLAEIPQKHLPHKRAIWARDVPVEIFLVQRDRAGFFTMFFDHRWHWPSDTFTAGLVHPPTASRSSLASYRAGWEQRPHLERHP